MPIIIEDAHKVLNSFKSDGWTHLTKKDHIPTKLHKHIDAGHFIIHKDTEHESDFVRSTYAMIHKKTGKATIVHKGPLEK